MTSLPAVPGAPALYLYREQVTDDSRHMFSFYVRLKVLTEGGKSYANVELPYYAGESGKTVDSISGRTIQPDGTIVPFTDKPYDKLIEKGQGFKVKAKVFTLPAVQVGSILEYRYKIHLDDHYFEAPDWIVQDELYLRKAHYEWRPTSKLLTSADGKTSETVAWTPVLPAGFKVVETQPPHTAQSFSEGNELLQLDIHDIAPILHEEYTPPLDSLSYRVLFYYTSFRNANEYWKDEGKTWARESDKFVGPNGTVKDAVQGLVQPGDTPDAKLRKLYAAVMQFDNTDLTRQHSTAEEKAGGMKAISSAGDVVTRKRGSSDQIALTFVAMARAAGLKAYPMLVADRARHIFLPSYLSLRQLDDVIAVVNVDGKDIFLDPGERDCSFGHLTWHHAMTSGLRETDGGTALTTTPGESYKVAHTSRVADLKLDDHGGVTGTVTLTYTGDPAVSWRQEARRGDDTSLNQDLKSSLERLLPGGMEVRVTKVDGLTDDEQPLVVHYDIKGAVGSATGKRLIVPANLFQSNAKPKFAQAKRDLPVDMHYASVSQDAVRYKFPPTLTVESVPTPSHQQFAKYAAYDAHATRTEGAVTTFRNVSMGNVLFLTADYPELREFYTKFETADQEPLILTRTDAATKGATPGGE